MSDTIKIPKDSIHIYSNDDDLILGHDVSIDIHTSDDSAEKIKQIILDGEKVPELEKAINHAGERFDKLRSRNYNLEKENKELKEKLEIVREELSQYDTIDLHRPHTEAEIDAFEELQNNRSGK